MKNLNEVMRILGGSKRFDFEYNENGYSCFLNLITKCLKPCK